MSDKIENILNDIIIKTAVNNKFRGTRLKERMKELNTSGLSFTVVKNGKIEATECLGVKEYGKKGKVTKDTMFLAGSISKPVFALIVMRLKQKGLLDLDTDVNSYLKRWKIPKVGKWQLKVTLRQILSHTAGFTVHGFRGYAKNEELPTITQILNGEKPANSSEIIVNILPGIQFRYAGGGTTVAQVAVEDLTGKTLPELAYEELINSLGLKNSTFEQVLPEAMYKRIATGHPEDNRAIYGKHHLYPEMAAAGFWTTSEDLATIMIEVQNGFKGKSKIFDRSTIEEMLTPNGTASHMGIGFMLKGGKGDERFGHGGSDQGFMANVDFSKDGSSGAVVMINSNDGYSLLDSVLGAIAREYKWKDYLPVKRKKVKILKSHLNRYKGKYKTDKNRKIEITTDGTELFMQYEDQEPILINSKNENDFFINDLNTSLSFEFNDKKKASKLTVFQEGNKIVAEKIK